MNIPGIKKLGYLPCRNLPGNLLERALCGLPNGVMSSYDDIDFVGNPDLKTNGVYLNRTHYEKAQLTFSVRERLILDEPVAFVAEDVEGNTWLLGVQESPSPVIEYTDSLGFPGEPNKVEYVVTYISKLALLSVG